MFDEEKIYPNPQDNIKNLKLKVNVNLTGGQSIFFETAL
jgi:hypothetical protein